MKHLEFDKLKRLIEDADCRTVSKFVGRRPRRWIAHLVTIACLVYLIVSLSRHGGTRSPTSSSASSSSSSSTRRKTPPEVDADVRHELGRLFKKADTTADGKLSRKELAWSISKSVEGHLVSAMRSNFRNFFALDNINKNGQVEWKEWLQSFNEKVSKSGESLTDRIVKEKLAAARAAWSEAARSNPDSLNIDEFLSFTHPESSHSILAGEAEDLFLRFDSNADGFITEAEYLKDPFVEFDPDELEIRRETFRQGFDADKNGKADKREVLTYLDPKHPFKSQEEADRLIKLADSNGDGQLDLEEILPFAEDFLMSRWANPERVFHGDLAML